MSTSPDELVTLLSQWLARHVGDTKLLAELDGVHAGELTAEQAELVSELARGLRGGAGRGELEMVARETLEVLALG